jgi:4-amino-4-deoxy-L-arabinose transferase-like glycosyltransferase
MRETRSDLLFLCFWSFLFCVVGIQWGSLASWDEAYYAVVSQGIHASGDWINLTFFDSDFYDKPPFYFWLTALGYHVFGVGEFATRLPSALAGIGTVLATYGVGKTLFDRRVGLAGAGVLMSSTDFLHYARWGTLDITQLFFFTAAILCFLSGGKNAKYYLAFWIFAAAAFMTKGPIILLAFGILGVYSLLKRDFSCFVKWEFWLGAVLAALMVLPWHFLAALRDPELFYQGYFYKHYIARTGQAVEGHSGNYYYYIRTLINKYHPWIILSAISLPLFIVRSFKSQKKLNHALILIWIAVVFIFFTFKVSTKLQWYILPLHPAISISIGAVLVSWYKHREFLMKLLFVIVLLAHIPFSDVIVQDYSPGIQAMASDVQKHVAPGQSLYLYEYHEQPASLFYIRRPTGYLDSMTEVDTAVERGEDPVILVLEEKYRQLKSSFDQRHFSLIERTRGLKKDLVLLKHSV